MMQPLNRASTHSTSWSLLSAANSVVRRPVVLAIVFASLAVFHVTTIRGGNYWPDDYALYVHHAKNIAQGSPYADTGYVYNRETADYSPRAYPPVFPLLLAPIYRVSGLNFHAMKIEEVAFLLLSLMAIAAYWRRDLTPAYVLSFVLVLGCSPVFWRAKDSVLSDLPFLFFFYAVALLAESPVRDARNWWKWALFAGAVLYLCVGTRTIGLTLIPGIALFDVVKRRRVTAFTTITVLTCAVLLLAQRRILGTGEQSYLDQLRPTTSSILVNIREYPRDLMSIWPRSTGRFGWYVLFGASTALALVGAYFHARRGLRIVEAMLLPYLLAVMLWPSPQGLRFLFPLVPFYLYLSLLGLSRLPDLVGRQYAAATVGFLLTMITVSYGLAYRHANFGTIAETDGLDSFNQLCAFVRDHTQTNDVFVFRRGRALSLFVSRPAAVYEPTDELKMLDYLNQVRANYVVSSPIFTEDRTFLIPLLHKFPDEFEPVYENTDFSLFRIHEGATSAVTARSTQAIAK